MTSRQRNDTAGRATYGAFSDPEAMMRAIQATHAWADGPYPLTKGGARFHAAMARGSFGGLSIGTGSFAPVISMAGTTASQHTFVFAASPNTARRVSGWELSGPQIFHLPPNARVVASSTHAEPWVTGFVTIPFEQLAENAPALLGAEHGVPRDAERMFDVPAPSMARLVGLVCDLARVAKETPWIIEAPEPAAAFSGTVLDALLACVSRGRAMPDRAALRRHREIVARFERALAERPDEMLSLGAICRVVGVAQRTLNLACMEFLGMSAGLFARQWRMGLVRERLLASDPATTMVTSVVMQYGFWELGRFARAYRLRFGERPSDTLRRRGG